MSQSQNVHQIEPLILFACPLGKSYMCENNGIKSYKKKEDEILNENVFQSENEYFHYQ